MGMNDDTTSNNNYKKSFAGNGLKINASIDWNAYTQQFKNVNDKDLYQAIGRQIVCKPAKTAFVKM